MDDNVIYNQAKNSYQAINNKWLRSHVKLLVCCAGCVTVMEILMFFVIWATSSLTHSVFDYWIKFVIIPVSIIITITIAGCLVYKNRQISDSKKQYVISILFSLFAFVLSLAHSGFVGVFIAAIFPILMTAMYENQRLCAINAALCAAFVVISGLSKIWDHNKVINATYLINIIIFLSAVFFTWLSCRHMIKFVIIKRDIVITNDVERYNLLERVNIDGLTGIGNKPALIATLQKTPAQERQIQYLAMMDIDKFKNINDNHGHLFGDGVLKCIGKSMRELSEYCECYRYGGDEFCAVYTDANLNAFKREIEYVQQYLKDNIVLPNNESYILISVGITRFSHESHWEEIITCADNALYMSKSQGGGCITVYEESKKA